MIKHINLINYHTLPIVFSVLLLIFCYPGFMSYDSIRMLEEARTQVVGGIYPPGPVYVLRFFDILGNGPTVMIFVQNYLLLFSLNAILLAVGASIFQAATSLIFFVAMPTVMGAMLVLWKDVTLASIMVVALAIIFSDYTKNPGRLMGNGIWISLLLIVLSATIRFNAITATAILTVFWIKVYFANKNMLSKLSAFVGITLVTVVVAGVVNNYRFPSMEKLQPNNLAYAIMSYDLIGVSAWSRNSLVPIDTAAGGVSEKAKISDIDKIYSSLGAVEIQNRNSSLGNLVKLYPSGYSHADIFKAWIAAIFSEPLAYLNYRWDVFSEIIGANNHETFEPTHFGKIDENKFSIKFRDNYLTDLVLNYIKLGSSVVIGKPWLFFLGVFVFVVGVFRKNISQKNKTLSVYSFAASMAYLLPFFILSGTGEVRYTFPSIMFGMVSLFVIFARNQEGGKDFL